MRELPEETGPVCDPAQPRVCFRAALKVMTGKWKGEILWSLKGGTLRFGELMRALPGITQHMLTAQLRELEANGLLTRTVFAEVPPRVEYALTEAAHDLKPVFEAIRAWAEKHGDGLALPDDEEVAAAPPRRAGRTG